MTDTATTAVMSSLFWLAATVAAPMAAGPTAGKPAHETMTVRNSTTYGHHVLPIGFCSPAEPAQFGSPESPAMPASGLCSTGNIILRRVTPVRRGARRGYLVTRSDLEPVSGIEPLTCRLQDGCSAN